MKKTLLATSALVGASLLAAPASAGTVGSKDMMNVSVGGIMWFSAYVKDEDVSANNGRGYGFTVSESEVWVNAGGKTDGGLNYGLRIELNGGAADGTAADEASVYMSGDWGKLELGDNDDVTNQTGVGAWNAAKGAGGPFGGLGDLNTVFNGNGNETLISRADWQVLTTQDATKASYMSPKFSGFQFGLSWTPDSGESAGGAATADSDANGSFENVLGVSATYKTKVGDASVALSAGWEHGDDEDANGAEVQDLDVKGIGASVSMAGFTVGAHYRDYSDTFLTDALTAAGANAGSQFSVGVGYQMGPLGISGWYLQGEKDNADTSAVGARETTVSRMGLGAGYKMAPGWDLRAELTFNNVDNPTTALGVGGTTDNDGRGFLLVNRFVF